MDKTNGSDPMAQRKNGFDSSVAGQKADDVHGDVVNLMQGSARDISGRRVDIRQAGVRDVEGQEVSLKQGGAMRIDAQDMTVIQSGVGIARADDIRIGPGSGAGFVAGNTVSIDQSQLPLVAARGDVTMDQSLSGVVVGSNVTLTQSAAGIVIAREVHGNVRMMVSPVAAAAFGVGVGVVLGLIRFAMHLRSNPPELPEIHNPLKHEDSEPDVVAVIRRRLRIIND